MVTSRQIPSRRAWARWVPTSRKPAPRASARPAAFSGQDHPDELPVAVTRGGRDHGSEHPAADAAAVAPSGDVHGVLADPRVPLAVREAARGPTTRAPRRRPPRTTPATRSPRAASHARALLGGVGPGCECRGAGRRGLVVDGPMAPASPLAAMRITRASDTRYKPIAGSPTGRVRPVAIGPQMGDAPAPPVVRKGRS